jgi:hypothetical protein
MHHFYGSPYVAMQRYPNSHQDIATSVQCITIRTRYFNSRCFGPQQSMNVAQATVSRFEIRFE